VVLQNLIIITACSGKKDDWYNKDAGDEDDQPDQQEENQPAKVQYAI